MNAGWLEQSAAIGVAVRGRDQAAEEQVRRTRREQWWAWASLFVLIVAWDAASRLDERVALPRMRIAHAAEEASQASHRIESADL
jgi:hypothetical protein